MSATELERLRDRVDELEEAIGLKLQLPPGLRMPGTARRLFGLLLKREFVSYEAAIVVLYGDQRTQHGTEPNKRLINTYLFHVRSALRPFGIAISTRRAEGAFMTRVEKEKARALIERLWSEVRS